MDAPMPSDQPLGLLERDAELEELRSCVDAAVAGAGTVVAIEGVGGIGKTRLLASVRAYAAEHDARTLSARGTELERAFAFGVVRQLLEPVVLGLPGAERERLLAGPASAARSVFLDRDAGDDGGDASPETFSVLNGLYWTLVGLAEARPLVLVVDDAQWCDAQTQRFIRFLLPRMDGMRCSLVLGARPDEGDLLDRLSTDPDARLLRPRPLSVSAVATAARRAMPGPVAPEFAAACHTACGGNPFLLHELLTELREDGLRGGADEARAVRRVAPRSVQLAIVRRIRRLGDDALTVAHGVALLGESAEPGPLAALTGLEPAACERAADALGTADVLERGRPLRFTHPLVGNAVVASMSHGERAAGHRRAAGVLYDAGAAPERVATQLLESEPAGERWAVDCLLAAARDASRRGAPDVAVACVRRALVEDPRAPDWAANLLLLVRSGLDAMDVTALDGVCADPSAALAGIRDARVDHELAALLQHGGRVAEAVEVLEQAVRRALDEQDAAAVVALEPLRVLYAQLPPTRARDRIESVAHLVVPGSPAERLLNASRSHWASLEGTSAVSAVEHARAALADGHLFEGDLNDVSPTQVPFVLLLAEEIDLAEHALDLWQTALARRSARVRQLGVEAARACVARVRGEVRLAEAGFDSLIAQLREAGVDELVPPWVAWLVDTLVERGALAPAEAALADTGLDGALPVGYWATRVRFARGRLRIAQGRPRDALDDLVGVRDYMDLSGEHNPAWMPWASTLASVAAQLDRVDEARIEVEDELRRARAWGTPAPIGRALRAQAQLAGGDPELLRAAVEELEGSALQLDHLHARCDLGAALRRTGAPAEAREHLHVVFDKARRLGASALAGRAETELAASGETVRAAGRDELTASEHRIARMAADGLTNRDIAQALFVSVKTVETHLSAAYRKLDIAGRGELAGALGS